MRATTIKVRRESLRTVLDWFEDATPAPPYPEMLELASQTAQYLTTPWVVRIRVGLVVDQDTGEVINPQPRGVPVQLTDSQQVSYQISALDAKGYEVVETNFEVSSSDENVVTVNDSGDQDSGTWTAVAGRPGSATLTWTDGTLTATEAIDVVPGNIATIQIQGGTPEEQPAAGGGGDAGAGDGDGGLGGGGDTGGDVTPPTDGGVPAGGGDPAVDPDNPDTPVVNPI